MDLLERTASPVRHPWELARFHVVKDLVDQQIKQYEGKKILDIGCGDLYFLKRFAEDKPASEFFAVDKGLDDEMILRESGMINCYRSLEQLPRDASFDIIFMMDLLEHVEDDFDYLKRLLEKPFVDENTLFVITVPAYETLYGQHDRFLGHFRRYSNSSLEKVTCGAGLRTIQKGYFFLSLLLPRYMQIIWEKLNGRGVRESGASLSGWGQNKFITEFLKNALLMDYRIHRVLKKVRIPTPGLSNYIVCRKPVL